MGDTMNLIDEKAVKKIRELAKDANICHFVTNLSTTPLSSRPMATQQVDDDGNIWFISDKESDKNHDIQSDDRVQLFYAANGNYEYLSVYGTAEIVFDKAKIHELWTSMAKAWFPDGVDDPAISLIKVSPEDGYYWDTKNNKLVSLFKIAKSMVTGKTDDDGVQGTLKV
ncbi:MAG: pyridoxamine 5'-phosphate oxidase family protein [Ginsengibacter sp.]